MMKMPGSLRGGVTSIALATTLGVLAPAVAQAQYVSVPFKVAAPGERIVLGYYYNLDGVCHSLGSMDMHVVVAPVNGELGTGEGSNFPNFPGNNTHSACNHRRVPVSYLYYRSTPDFRGTAVARVTVTFADSTARIYSYVISVRPKG